MPEAVPEEAVARAILAADPGSQFRSWEDCDHHLRDGYLRMARAAIVQRDEELRERLKQSFDTSARWAQEDAEAHAAKGRSESVPLARERERVFRGLANNVGDIFDGKKPLRSIFEEADDARP